MYRLKSIIQDIGPDRVVNKDIKVEGGKVYVETEGARFMHEHEAWHMYTNRWVNLQGGVPMYEIETNLDEKLFEEVD